MEAPLETISVCVRNRTWSLSPKEGDTRRQLHRGSSNEENHALMGWGGTKELKPKVQSTISEIVCPVNDSLRGTRKNVDRGRGQTGRKGVRKKNRNS